YGTRKIAVRDSLPHCCWTACSLSPAVGNRQGRPLRNSLDSTNSLDSPKSPDSPDSLDSLNSPDSLPVCVLIMQPQQVRSEIAVEVTPHRMDMVCLILRVIVLYQEGRPLDAIIVRLARLRTASPGERDISKLSSSEPLHSRRRDFRRHIICVK